MPLGIEMGGLARASRDRHSIELVSYMGWGATREGTEAVPRGAHFGLACESPRLLPYASAAAG